VIRVPPSVWLVVAASLAGALPAPPARGAEAGDPLPAQLSLDAALRIGRARQPQLRQARALSEAAEARVDIARAPLLPQVNITAGYTRTTANFAPRPGALPTSIAATGTTSFDTFNFWTSGVTASQLLWDFGQTWKRKQAAEATADAQENTERAAQLSADFAVRNTFFVARAARDGVVVARESLANRTRHVEQVRAFTEVGTRPEIDLLQALTDQANAEVALINAQNEYANARTLLNQAMGFEGSAGYEVTGGPIEAVPGEDGGLEPLLDEAVRARPEIATQVDRLRAQELATEATSRRYWPAVAASTGLTYNGRDLGRMVWNWSGGLSLAWPILEGGAVRAGVREGTATANALRAEIDLARLQVRVEVEQARLGVTSAKAAVGAAERALANARARLELAEVRYRTGVGSGIELSDAQLAATAAAFQKLQATLRLDTTRAQLQRALGRF
jgi:outer membrane protein